MKILKFSLNGYYFFLKLTIEQIFNSATYKLQLTCQIKIIVELEMRCLPIISPVKYRGVLDWRVIWN